MKHVDVLHSCAIMTATVQTAERQGRHWYHISTPKLTIHALMQESIHCSSTGIFLSSKAPELNIMHTGARSLKRAGAVLSGESCIPREQGRARSYTSNLCFGLHLWWNPYSGFSLRRMRDYWNETVRHTTHRHPEVWATHKNYVKNMKYIWKIFPKATFTSRFDLAHCLSQLKIRPWKMPIVRLLICVRLVEQRKAVSLPGIYKTLIILLI